MTCVISPPLASIEAFRPVFMIVMGVFLMIIAWRLAKGLDGWSARLIVAGTLLLGLGYAVVLPLYDAGVIPRFSSKSNGPGNSPDAHAWNMVKTMVMNFGWLFFGLGLALHAKIFPATSPGRKLSPPTPATNESPAQRAT
jgi:hypothetical protein